MYSAKQCVNVLLASLMAGLGGGCKTEADAKNYSLTYHLWSQNNTPSFCRPLAGPDLALFRAASGQDWLVVYNCASELHPGSHRRAYFLEENRTNSTPHFVDLKIARGLPSVPVVKQFKHDKNPTPTNTCAIWYLDMENTSFTLYRPGSPPETSSLPCYPDWIPQPETKGGTWWRKALTPITMTVDITVGVAVVATCIWMAVGAPGY